MIELYLIAGVIMLGYQSPELIDQWTGYPPDKRAEWTTKVGMGILALFIIITWPILLGLELWHRDA